MNCSTPGLPVHHQLWEFTLTHVHRVGDAIRPSHPLVVPFSSCPQSLPASAKYLNKLSREFEASALEILKIKWLPIVMDHCFSSFSLHQHLEGLLKYEFLELPVEFLIPQVKEVEQAGESAFVTDSE